MSLTLRIAAEAKDDILNAAEYYSEARSGLGGEFVDLVLQTAASLVDRPNKYQEVRPGIRQVVLRNFTI